MSARFLTGRIMEKIGELVILENILNVPFLQPQ